MAKLAVTAAFIFLMFAVSHARIPLDLQDNEPTTHDLSTNLLESDPATTTATILLPSEKPESEQATAMKLEPETTESKLPYREIATVESLDESKESDTDSVPLTVIFRPINRHFPRRPLLPFGHRRGCHHHHQFKPWGPRSHAREIPYGNDMLMSGQDLSFDNRFPGEARHIPARWVRIHHGGGRFRFRHDVDGTENGKRPQHHVEVEENEREEREERQHEGGFMKKIRKFLNHF